MPEVLGGCRILREAGRGGMAVVYEARRLDDGARVAVKRLLPEAAASPVLRKRFARETAALGKLDHPHVARVFAQGEEGGVPHLVMEFVTGETLGDRLARRGARAADGAEIEAHCRWAIQVAEALHAAHAQGLLHRDVTPRNIMLDENDQAKLLDFGLTRPLEADTQCLTVTGKFVGTTHYVPPEQVMGHGQRLDRRADVYSLAASLFQAVTGRVPFPGDSMHEVFAGVLAGEAPSAAGLNPAVPPALDWILQKALQRDPARRHPDAAALARDLRRFLARPGFRPNWSRDRLLDWSRNHSRLLAGCGLLLAVCALWLSGRADPMLRAAGLLGPPPAVLHFDPPEGVTVLVARRELPGWQALPPATRAEERELAPGHYVLTLEGSGFRRRSQALELLAGDEFAVDCARHFVAWQDQPPISGARVLQATCHDLDGDDAAETVLVLEAEDGSHRLECRRGDGAALWSRALDGRPLLPARIAGGSGEAATIVVAVVEEADDRIATRGLVLGLAGGTGATRWSWRTEVAASDGVFAPAGSGFALVHQGAGPSHPGSEPEAEARLARLGERGELLWEAEVLAWKGAAPTLVAPGDGGDGGSVLLGYRDGKVLACTSRGDVHELYRKPEAQGTWLAGWAARGEATLWLLGRVDSGLDCTLLGVSGDRGAYATPRSLGLKNILGLPECGDFDHDGAADLLLTDPDGRLAWVRHTPEQELRNGIATAEIDERWLYDEPQAAWVGPARTANLDRGRVPEVIAATRAGTVLCLSGSTGEVLWRAEAGGEPAAPPAAGDLDGDGRSELIVVLRDGRVRVLRPPLPYPR